MAAPPLTNKDSCPQPEILVEHKAEDGESPQMPQIVLGDLATPQLTRGSSWDFVRRESRLSLNRLNIVRRFTKMNLPPSPVAAWPAARTLQTIAPRTEPVDTVAKANMIASLNQPGCVVEYLNGELSPVHDHAKKLGALVEALPTFPRLNEVKLGAADMDIVGAAPALLQAFMQLTTQHAHLCNLLQQASAHVTMIEQRVLYIEAEKQSFRARERAFVKSQREYLQLRPNRSAEQLLQEDLKYANDKRELQLQKFRLAAKMGELRLASKQTETQFTFAAVSSYLKFLELARAPAALEPVRKALLTHEGEMAERLHVCDSVQADLEVEVDATNLARFSSVASVEAGPLKGSLFTPGFGVVALTLHSGVLTLQYEKGVETLSCRACAVETRDSDKRFAFRVVAPQRTHILQADSQCEMQKWVTAIQSAIATAVASS